MTTVTTSSTIKQALQFLGNEPLAGHVRKALGMRYTPYFTNMERANGIGLINLFYDPMHLPFDALTCSCNNRTRSTNMVWYRQYYGLVHQAIPVCNKLVWDGVVMNGFQEGILRLSQRGMSTDSANWDAHNRVRTFAEGQDDQWFTSPGQDGYIIHPGRR